MQGRPLAHMHSNPVLPLLLLQGVDLKGVPPLAPCRIRLLEQDASSGADAVRAREAALPSSEQQRYRDATGDYSATAPFWAMVADAK